MPKKRFSTLYTKPSSTPHSSFGSAAVAGSSNSSRIDNDAAPSVNELIQSSRATQVTAANHTQLPPTFTSNTLPPQTRRLLSLPETPAPRARRTRPYNQAFGPAPPQSWLERSIHAPPEVRNAKPERLYPVDIDHLPSFAGDDGANGKYSRLQDICLRAMARDWEFFQMYEKNNLADIPTPLRMLLLSNIAVEGPEEGVGIEALKDILVPPTEDGERDKEILFDTSEHNERFYRLDLSGSVGRSVSIKQIIDIVTVQKSDEAGESWEEIARPISAMIPHLTHLSLSHPPPIVSWPRLLTLSEHLPTLTHLSLAFWPAPNLTPNSKTTYMSSKFARDTHYSGTNLYSHLLDNDFQEAASILRRLFNKLYSLEFLDLGGCTNWWKALRWQGDNDDVPVLEFDRMLPRLKTLRVFSGVFLDNDSKYIDVAHYVLAYKEQLAIKMALEWWSSKNGAGAIGRKRNGWVGIQMDDCMDYDDLWKGEAGVEEKRKKQHLSTLSNTGLNMEAIIQRRLVGSDVGIPRNSWDREE